MWIYFAPVVAHRFFGGEPGTPAYQRGVEWSGVCLATYSGVACLVAFGLVALARRGIPTRMLYRFGLICAGAGLLAVGLWQRPEYLLISMVGVGIGWATILSMPYAMLADAIPAARMGFYMGVFNFFIVLPQILAATVLGPVVQYFFGGQPPCRGCPGTPPWRLQGTGAASPRVTGDFRPPVSCFGRPWEKSSRSK